MAWIPGAEQRYYNPTTNRIPASIFTNHFEPALEDAETHILDGIDTDRSDDIPTAWDTLRLPVVVVPILPLVVETEVNA